VLVAAAGGGIYLLALLACPVSMGLMMLFMGRGMMGGKKGESRSTEKGSEPALEDLKAEQARLAEKIALLDRDAAPAHVREDGATEREAIRTGA
jgi:Protein of unknown function (DUF2933)